MSSNLENLYNSNVSHWELYARQPERYLCEYYTIFKTITANSPTPGSLSGMRLLDLGCGNGDISIESLRRGAEYVIGVDFAENQVIRARQIASEEGFSDMTFSFIRGNVFEPESVHIILPLSTYGGTFDVVFLLWILDYSQSVEAYRRLVQLGSSYLKTGGTLMIMECSFAMVTHMDEINKKNVFGDWIDANPTPFGDHWQIDNTYLNPQTGEINFTEKLDVFSKEQCREAIESAGLVLDKCGPLELDPKYRDMGYKESDFACLTEEIGGYYYYKGIKL